MKINKKFFLAVFNIGSALFLGYFILGNGFLNLFVPLDFGSLLHHYLPTALMLFFLSSNLWSAHHLIRTKDETGKNLKLSFVMTIHTIVWFLILFLGYFFVSNSFFPIASLFIVIADFLLLRRIFKKVAYIFSVATLLVVVLTVLLGFEEDYCWKKGEQADPTGSKIAIATEEDKKLFDTEVIPGQTQVGVVWQAHMRCHENFNFINALKEKYLFSKK